MHRNEENLTENHTTPIVSEIHTIQSVPNLDSCFFINLCHAQQLKGSIDLEAKIRGERFHTVKER